MKRLICATLLLFLFSPLLQALEPGHFVSDGPSQQKKICLTFDDGPGLFTQEILAELKKHNIRATFFMNGDQVEIRPELAKEVLKAGHEIADHTYSHLNFYAYEKKWGEEKTKLKAKDEMAKSKQAIQKILGVEPKICRMPNGFHRKWLGPVAKEFNYGLVNWTFGQDWLKISAAEMTQNYLKHVKPGAILLFHDGGRHREKTVAALPAIIQKIKEQNLTCVTVSEMFKDK